MHSLWAAVCVNVVDIVTVHPPGAVEVKDNTSQLARSFLRYESPFLCGIHPAHSMPSNIDARLTHSNFWSGIAILT